MRVLTAPMRGWVDPQVAFAALCATESHAVWLDSGANAASGMSVIGSAARTLTASVHDATVTVDGEAAAGSVFEFLRDDLARRAVPEAGAFALGWVGWLGYELRAQTMTVAVGSRSRYPDAALVFLDRAVVFDHGTRTVTLVALGERWDGELAEWRDATVSLLTGAPKPRGLSSERSGDPRGLSSERSSDPRGLSSERSSDPRGLSSERSERIETSWAHTDQEYLGMIRECQSAIAAGDAYLLCLTTEARVDVTPDPFETYLALRGTSPTHHGSFLRMGDVSLLSASPERFITVTPTGEVRTSPIKGTRRRGSNPDDDDRLRGELQASEKERAENLMIVDLMRNDIGRIARLGSVRVSDLLTVETYAQVHQLVSTVQARLSEGLTGVDAVVSCFPAGSMTGAPKRSATEILDRLERRARGIYSGAVGYFGLDGRVDLAMVIRSIVLDPQGATIGTGGGITALSVPEEELDEVHLKAAALLRVLGAGHEHPSVVR